MRDLRQRLMDIAKSAENKRAEPPRASEPTEGFFCREDVVPRGALGDIDRVTLEDVRACDP